MQWVAISYGAVDVADHPDFQDASILALPATPGMPLALNDLGASLWSRLVQGPIDDAELSAEELEVVVEMGELGFASSDVEHASRQRALPKPRLSSPLHELVYALVGRVASACGAEIVFIKGPVLYLQGLREREHSGDVDLWASPRSIPVLTAALAEWGWRLQPIIWEGTAVNHSVTLTPPEWACELDIHRYFPGIGVDDNEAFALLYVQSETTEMASVEIRVPNVPAHAVISALHLMRPEVGRKTAEATIESAAECLRLGGPESFRFARAIGALGPLQEPLRRAFPSEALGGNLALPWNWTWRMQKSRGAAYWVALRTLPLVLWPRMIWRIVWPTREIVLASDLMSGGTGKGLFGAHWRRLRRGLKQFLS